VHGTWAVWVRCPAVANDLATRGRIVIGWAPVRISGFKVRPSVSDVGITATSGTHAEQVWIVRACILDVVARAIQ